MLKYFKEETIDSSIMFYCDCIFSYWEMSKENVGEELHQLAVFILSAICQSATCERLFSRFGFFQTCLRNRLGPKKIHHLEEVKRSVSDKD